VRQPDARKRILPQETPYVDWNLRLRPWLLLLIALTLLIRHDVPMNRVKILALLAVAALFYLLRPKIRQEAFQGIGLIFNLAFTSLLVHWSGGLNSLFFSLYFLDIVLAASVYNLSGTMLYAVCAGLGATLAEISRSAFEPSRARVDDVLSTLPYLFLVAYVAGVLVQRWREEAALREEERISRAILEEKTRRHDEDLKFAVEVQRALLPKSLPKPPGCELAARFNPQREVGGDFYETHLVNESLLELIVADVRGKGLSAALLLTGLKRSLDYTSGESIRSALAAINRDLCPDTPAEMFATLFYGRLRLDTGILTYGSAGHLPFLIYRPSEDLVIEGKSTGIPLGLLAEQEYEEERLQLLPGDVLACFTDGLAERREDCVDETERAADPDSPQKILILRGLGETLRRCHDEPAERICDRLWSCAGLPSDQEDDVTLVVLKWKSPQPHGDPSTGNDPEGAASASLSEFRAVGSP
jgi:serine phosphatase RsbU (regulator of sigma subunit)